MIWTGERNHEEKLKDIAEFIKGQKEEEIRLAKRRKILFVCPQCGLQISFESEQERPAYMIFHFDDYDVFFKDNPDYVPFDHNYKNIRKGSWGNYVDHICLDCGHGILKEGMTEIVCEKCGSGNIIFGSDLGSKPCPICGTLFNEGIELQGWNEYQDKQSELREEWWNIYRERYHVKKPAPPQYTKEEIAEQERREAIRENYHSDMYFVLNNPHNVLRFEFEDAFHFGSFYCILEWDDGEEGKLILFSWSDHVWVEKNIEYEKIEKVIEMLNKYDYFNKSFFKDHFGLDGWTFGLEVKYQQNYKELAIWGIERGILYDVGMLLISMAGKTFKELYEYAW